MKKMISSLTTIFLVINLSAQVIPYQTLPDWISTPNGHRATGLGLADINGDGWKDLVAANGNDMARQHLVVYYNNQDGTFPLNPDWESDDIDYHGHLACGDIDADGDIDVAVSVYIGASGFSSPGKVKVYYNMGSELEALPGFVSDEFYTFSCALGDADGDGDLDLAATGGEPYSSLLDYGRIFINNSGIFELSYVWESDIPMGALDVEFGDINRDGYMDVIFVCEGTDNYIFPGMAQGGIDPSPAWHSSEPESYINSVDIGYRGDHETLVVMTENSQLGGQGRVRSYAFDGNFPSSGMADWYSDPFGYGSGIFLADVDLDSSLDLIYGGWWLPVKIARGVAGGFEMASSYTSSTGSVVETIQMADLGRESISEKVAVLTITLAGSGIHLLVLPEQIVESVLDISVNGVPLSPAQYCNVPNKGWVSIGIPLQALDMVVVHYEYSPHPDIAVTNWDNNIGNYIFYNTSSPVGVGESLSSSPGLMIYPNPVYELLNLHLSGSSTGWSLRVTDLTGRVLIDESVNSSENDYMLDVSALDPGVYIISAGRQAARFIKQ